MESEILELEASFADAGYAPWEDRLAINPRMFQKYAEPRQLWDWRQFGVHLLGDVRDKSLLDLGCGMGEEAVYFAKLGARVSAIDISEVGVRITHKRAEFNNVADRVSAEVMQATPTNFASESFDIVHGIGILHHVGLADGLAETKRLLKPGGTGLFLEPMGNSRLVEGAKEFIQSRWGKKLKLRDVNEHEETLKFRELMKFKDTFACYRLYPYHLLTRVRKLLFPQRVHDMLRRIDYRLLKMAPFLRHYAGAVVIHLRK